MTLHQYGGERVFHLHQETSETLSHSVKPSECIRHDSTLVWRCGFLSPRNTQASCYPSCSSSNKCCCLQGFQHVLCSYTSGADQYFLQFLTTLSCSSCFWSSLLFFEGVTVDSCGPRCCTTWLQAALPPEPWVPVQGEPCMGFEQQRGMYCYTEWIVVVNQQHVFESSLKAWKI